MTQSCSVCKELNPKSPTNPNIDPEQPITDLQPFEAVGLDMFLWKLNQYLLVVDRMSGYMHRITAAITHLFIQMVMLLIQIECKSSQIQIECKSSLIAANHYEVLY